MRPWVPSSRSFQGVGEQPFLSQQQQGEGAGGGIKGPQFGEVVLELTPAEDRTVSANELITRWRSQFVDRGAREPQTPRPPR